ncbi:Flagellar basal-body rod protein flgF [Roseomonas mucosa]|uniref:Flagellar basal-body rod protein flgF n=1 Tax=Roseomonas mucosa TaxID=207340 RepID=A0A4Y1MW76_9PROT|nr:Flagellar basal-body rod protein flgF [Roseomonas mucosa]
MLDGIGSLSAWAVIQKNGETLRTRFETRKDMTADADRLRAAAKRFASVEDLMKDRRSLKMVLEAYQLEDLIDQKAVVKKLLTEDPGSKKSYANRMVDPRLRAINKQFGGQDGNPLADSKLVGSIIDKALENRFEKDAGDGNAGLREALYFQRQASSVTSLAGLMADTALTAVVKGAYALPSQFALLDYDKQKAILAKRVDFDDLKDPKKVAKMIQRYLVKEGDQSSGSVSMVLSLFDSGNDATSNLISLAGRKVSLLA